MGAPVLSSPEKPLAHCRLVATLPPKSFFGGNNLLRGLDHVEALKALGAAVYTFDTNAVYTGDRAEIERQKSEIIDFRPDAVIGTPHAGYVVQGGMIAPASARGRPRNLFLDDLGLPAILFWDHALTQAARYLLNPVPERPSDSCEGILDALRGLFRHPRIVHFFPDSGHAKTLDELGVASFDDSAWYVQGVARPFAESGADFAGPEQYDEEVAFFGNLYLASAMAIPYSSHQGIAELRASVRTACAGDWNLSAYQAYCQAIAGLDADVRSSLRLELDQSFYWRFLYEELSRFMNARYRLEALQSCGRPVACIGNFNDPGSSKMMTAPFVVRPSLPYDGSLAAAFCRTRVVVDVANAPFINGFSVKPMACFAAGGFMLTSRRSDLIRALGPVANEIMFDDADEFAGKVDRFLSDDRRRRELTREIGSLVRARYRSESLFAITVPKALHRLSANR